MFAVAFWKDVAERAVRAFAVALLGVFTANETVATIHWQAVLTVAATALVGSVLLSLASVPVSGARTASLLPASTAPGQHEDPQGR